MQCCCPNIAFVYIIILFVIFGPDISFKTAKIKLRIKTDVVPASHGSALTVQQDLKQHHLMLPEAADLAQNRPLWRMMSTYGAT